MGKNYWEECLGSFVSLCVKQGEMLPVFLRIVGVMMSRFICTHSMLIIWGEELLGNNLFGEEFLGPLVSLCVKQGEMLPIFLRIVGAMMSRFFGPIRCKSVWGKNFLERIFGGIIFGAIGIFVCKTGRNAAHFSQICWGHDVKIYLHPFDVNHFWGRTFGKEFIGEDFVGPGVSLCVKQGKMLPSFLRIAGAMMSRFFCTHSMSIIWGKNLWERIIGKNFWGHLHLCV